MTLKSLVFIAALTGILAISTSGLALECHPDSLQKYQTVTTCTVEDNQIPRTMNLGSILHYYQQSYSFECSDACGKPLTFIVVLEKNCEGGTQLSTPPQIYDPGYNEDPPSTRANDQLKACAGEKVRIIAPLKQHSKEFEVFSLRFHKAFDPILKRSQELESR